VYLIPATLRHVNVNHTRRQQKQIKTTIYWSGFNYTSYDSTETIPKVGSAEP